MKRIFTKGRILVAAICIALMAAFFLAGAHHGYELGYADGESQTHGWWIDKKARYFESAEVTRKRMCRNHNHI